MPTLERKYLFAEGAGPLILEWISSACAVDPDFKKGSISSLYYDTSDFRLYHEKRGSDFQKVKARLRWYSTLEFEDDRDGVDCFLELKTKEGARRHKSRMPVRIAAGELRSPYRSAVLRDLPTRLLEKHSVASAPLNPLIVVSYFRWRFVAPELAARICIDTGIRCSSANPGLLPFSGPTVLADGVLETKSPQDELVGLIRPINHFLHKRAFSKYASLLEALDQPKGVRL